MTKKQRQNLTYLIILVIVGLATSLGLFQSAPDQTTEILNVPENDLIINQEVLLNSDHTASMASYLVTKVVDGDTIKVDLDGEEKTIRLIGVDTPETVHPQKEVECFGVEASDYVRNLLTGENVILEADTTQDEADRYGRLLRYVYLLDGRHLNLLIISEGYGFEYTYAKPYLHQETFKTAQKEAEINQRGLWHPHACAQ